MKMEDFNVEKFQGIDIEPEDREVGIMDSDYSVGIIDDEGKQVCLHFNTDEFYLLCQECNKHWQNFKDEEKIESEIEEEARK